MTHHSTERRDREPGDGMLITLKDLSRIARKREIIDVTAVVLRRWCVNGVKSRGDGLPIYLAHKTIGQWYRSSVDSLRDFIEQQEEGQ